MGVWEDILAQGANLQQVIAAHSRPEPELDQAAEIIRRAGRVTYLGVGSGLNATVPAAAFLNARGFPAACLDASEALYMGLPALKGSALVLNTRSGETVELVRIAHEARRLELPVVTVTNEPGSSAGRLANACLPTHSRWDELVVLSAYGGMLASELALAGAVVNDREVMLSGLQAASGALPGVLDQVIAGREALIELFKDARPIYLLGRGPALASCWGGALVLEEMARRPCVAMAAGLFRQGPVEVVDERFRAVLFGGAGDPGRLQAALGRTLLKAGGGVLWVGPGALEGALQVTLPELPDYLLPLLEILPCQVLAYDLAQRLGIRPGEVRFISKVITSEEIKE